MQLDNMMRAPPKSTAEEAAPACAILYRHVSSTFSADIIDAPADRCLHCRALDAGDIFRRLRRRLDISFIRLSSPYFIATSFFTSHIYVFVELAREQPRFLDTRPIFLFLPPASADDTLTCWAFSCRRDDGRHDKRRWTSAIFIRRLAMPAAGFHFRAASRRAAIESYTRPAIASAACRRGRHIGRRLTPLPSHASLLPTRHLPPRG